MRPTEQMCIRDGNLYYKCKFCEETAKSGSTELRLWEMNHLHFGDGDIDVLLCNKCKSLNPTEILERLEITHPTDDSGKPKPQKDSE